MDSQGKTFVDALLSQNKGSIKLKTLARYEREEVMKTGRAVVNSPGDASPYIFNFSLPGYRSETVLHFMEERGVLVSSGSACGKGEKSHTLTAMGLSDELVDSAVRVSFSSQTQEEDVRQAAALFIEAVNTLQRK